MKQRARVCRSLHDEVAEFLRLRCDSIIDASLNDSARKQTIGFDDAPFSIPFDEIGGCEDAKAVLTQATCPISPFAPPLTPSLLQAIVWPLTRSAEMRALGTRGITGVVLHGPPGCGKTSLARALAALAPRVAFFAVAAPEIVRGRDTCALRALMIGGRCTVPWGIAKKLLQQVVCAGTHRARGC